MCTLWQIRPRSELRPRPADAFAENAAGADPAVNAAPVVADLVAPILDGFDDVQIFCAVHTAQNDVANREGRGIGGATVQSCPDAIRPFMEWPRGRNKTISPLPSFRM